VTGVRDAKLEVRVDPEALARRVAEWLLELATSTDGTFVVALSGGSIPRPFYEYLASPRCRNTFPWSRTHWF
jgi:6-phosphogluconolactonase